jgi:hypothetical protein
MCLVIDTCCLAIVFEGDNKKHGKFIPVLKWITEGKGRMIYGGTKYDTELGKTTKILGIVGELRKARRAIHLEAIQVDPIADALKAKCPEPEFDDEHIVALVLASRCCVVCTIDGTAMAYLDRVDLFRDYHVDRPKIYNGHKTHRKLCCDKHIVEICREAA